jgi:hypothetical protein
VQGCSCLGRLAHRCGSVRYQGEVGVYHGVLISKVDRIIAIGNPPPRQPRAHNITLANAVHDRFRMSPVPRLEAPRMEPPQRRTPLRQICSGDSIGFGYEFASAGVFFTYNGVRLRKRVPRSICSPRQVRRVRCDWGERG